MSPRWSRARSTSPVPRPGTNALFAGRNPQAREVYERLTSALRSVGPVIVETKRSSIHLVAGATGNVFAEIHPQKAVLILNVGSAEPLTSPRVRRVEQNAKHRFQNELLLASPDDVNAELLCWLRAAYELACRET